MRIQKSEAFVLHTLPMRERDKLVVFFTPEHGKRRGWAYGARSMKNRFGSALEPLSRIRISFVERDGDELVRIESVDLVRSLFAVHSDLRRSLSATFIAELADTFAQAGEDSELLFRLLESVTATLLEAADPAPVVVYAEIWTLKLAGIFPSMTNCSGCHRDLALPLRFDQSSGAFVCRDCASRDTSIVPNDVLARLEELLRYPVSRFATTPLSSEALIDLRMIARSLRRNFLGHELKSYDLLASVL